ncbi:protein with hydrophobic anchor [Listeria ilorinensis]|uniref:protein with hydrophobic anchor n=1 Tax=Listeria ilorinensis TaxID=2867439 RepID=UPI001EF6E8D2|nr:protein with hydrophobic anchor [Listeria ilorinensis]
MKKFLFPLVLTVLLILGGCGTVKNTVKINLDGTTDLRFDIQIGAAGAVLLEPFANQLTGELEAQGFDVTEKENGHYLFDKTFKPDPNKQTTDFKKKAAQYGLNFQEEKGFLFDTYHVKAHVDVPEWLSGTSYGEKISSKLLRQIDYMFVLDLPISTVKDSNADQVHGGKLTWHVPLDKPTVLYFDLTVPNVRNIAITGSVAVILVTVLVMWLIRRRKRRRKLKDVD